MRHVSLVFLRDCRQKPGVSCWPCTCFAFQGFQLFLLTIHKTRRSTSLLFLPVCFGFLGSLLLWRVLAPAPAPHVHKCHLVSARFGLPWPRRPRGSFASHPFLRAAFPVANVLEGVLVLSPDAFARGLIDPCFELACCWKPQDAAWIASRVPVVSVASTMQAEDRSKQMRQDHHTRHEVGKLTGLL